MPDLPLHLLLVEDNPADIFLMEAALDLDGFSHTLTVARDGQEALKLLEDALERGTLPDLVLLDLNLPRLNGFDVLGAIRSHPQLRQLTVVVFTTSTASTDVQRAYTLRADSYVTKPAGLDEFLGIVRQLGAFWSQGAHLPCTHARPS
ncbi:response regulator [Deinococcus sp. YIM 77859]|uniref:response regulator n=1 Tax=Deinococcus sp. YIM 77859 TaxID=1540221 RepID=UPI00055824F1|nr:response regulator [Deinococcus sp. YIM 77859]